VCALSFLIVLRLLLQPGLRINKVFVSCGRNMNVAFVFFVFLLRRNCHTPFFYMFTHFAHKMLLGFFICDLLLVEGGGAYDGLWERLVMGG
jgi:hypothetical protein